ncbi:MAG: UbiA family prenyltransferase [Defluviitaleaceae bacterium]|nr:UbiA family prenyltransferase [Defluviitaleaceae bacterium]
MKKWWIYQKERFPLIEYVPMILAFAISGLNYTARLIGQMHTLQVTHYLVGSITMLIWFMLMRIADEHKDYEEDKKYRPYRAIPRGLITLKELRYLGIILIGLQLGLTFWFNPSLLPILLLSYLWFGLISIEFGVAHWLKKQHTLYLLSHTLMMVMISIYLTGIVWTLHKFPINMVPYLLSGYLLGLVFEIGRKLRAPSEEEKGVETYTVVWGIKKAVISWLICVSLSFISIVVSSWIIGLNHIILIVFTPLYVIVCYGAICFIKAPTQKKSIFFKLFSAVWLLLVYVVLGIISWLF